LGLLACATTGGQSPVAAVRSFLQGEFVHLKNASILISGAGSGIRPALALRLAEDTPRLTLVGRRQQPLDELADRVRQQGDRPQGVTGDLTEPGAPQMVVASARAGFGGIDVLVNNAGNVRAGRLEAIDESEGHGSGRGQPDGTDAAHPRGAAQPAGVRPRPGPQLSLGIGLIAMRFYSTYAATKAGIAPFGGGVAS